MLLQAAIDIIGLTTVISTGAFALQNIDPDRHNKKARILLALNLLAPLRSRISNSVPGPNP